MKSRFEQDYIDDANRPTLSEVVYTPIDIIGGGAARCYGGRTCTNLKR